MPKTAIAIAVGLLALRGTADSKCAFASYRIVGTVIDCDSGQALADAQVFLFHDDSLVAWSPNYTESPVLTSDLEGKFEAAFRFNTYSGRGIIHADRCERQLGRLSVVVVHSGYAPTRLVLEGRRVPKLDRNLRASIALPPVRLPKEGSPCCDR